MRSYLKPGSLTLASAACAALMAGCSGSEPSGTDHEMAPEFTGSIGLDLRVAAGIDLQTVKYAISGNGFAKTGVINVGSSPKLGATIDGIPGGGGYTLALTATATDLTTSCDSGATFSISPHAVTKLAVTLDCHEKPKNGSLDLRGVVNVCPVIDGLSAESNNAFVGNSVVLSASAHDADFGPSPLSYQWTATSGTLSDAATLRPTFTCVAPGTATVTLTVSDGDPSSTCPDTLTTTVECTARDADAGGAPGKVSVQVLAINDFHGNMQPPAGSGGLAFVPPGDPDYAPDAGGASNIGVSSGGAAYLATHLANLRKTNPNTVVVSAGDLTGASPLISALFHDEPTIRIMNALGLDLNGVGNHEFDHGSAELLRLQFGGCHPIDGCAPGSTSFPGANFHYLAANVNVSEQKTIFPPYEIKTYDGEKIAFIGMTLEETPTIVSPSGVSGLVFRDEAATVNALVPELKGQGVAAIVVVIHQGGNTPANGTYNSCGVSGPIVDIANAMSSEVDVVVSAHTHQAYNCMVGEKLVTSASSFGRLITKIDLTLDKLSHRVADKKARNVIVTRDVPQDTTVASIVSTYDALSAPLANRVIGTVTGDLGRMTTAAGETVMGDVIADAQLDATAAHGFGDAVIAFMNPGGVRADIVFAKSGTEPVDGQVTYGEAFTVQPFGNSLVTLTLTGAQIKAVLEQQWQATTTRILHVSRGFTYTWDSAQPIGSRIVASSLALGGVPIDPAASFRVTVNSFLATGGDGFTVLTSGSNNLGGAVDIDALATYLGAHPALTPPAQNRITKL